MFQFSWRGNCLSLFATRLSRGVLLPIICCFLQLLPATAQVDFREETIYFLLTTRFYDGDPSNNRPNEWCSYIPGVTNPNITDPNDVTWRGDFKGLIEKLDYIKDLGFTSIWITPVVQNRGPLDYHGYHAWDFTKVDPRYESPGASFQELVNAVHAKGMKIILDIVTNHSGRFGIKGVAELKYNTDPTKPWYAPANPNWEYDGLTPNPYDNKLWSRANLAPMPAPYNSNLANFNWPSTEAFVNTSDINYFHQSGNGFVQGWDDTLNLYQRAIADDCPDINTGSGPARTYLINAYKQYINMGVDGLRWDTYKHMNKGDIQYILDTFKIIKPDLFIFGEVAQKRHELHPVEEINPHWYTWRGAVGNSPSSGASVLDFYGEATFHNVFEDGGPMSGAMDCARYDNLYHDPSQLVTWLDNHDFGPNNNWNQRFGGSAENLAACMNFMFLWRGIPSVYYGTEKQFKKGIFCDLHDAAGIQQSIDVTGRAYYGAEFESAPNHIMYKHIKRLNQIRKAVPALQKGTWAWAGNAPSNGVGFTRTLGSEKVAVGLAKDGSASFNFSGLPNGMYRDAVTGAQVNVTGGNLSFTVTSGSAGIYVLNGPGMIGDNNMGFFQACTSCTAQAPVVKVSPFSSNYTAPISVSITAAGGTGSSVIRYTLDGSTPTTSSPIYSGPFSVSSYKIVKAIAIDAAGKVSLLDGQQYTFVPPTPKATITPAAGNYYDPISVAISANNSVGPYTIYYTTNGTNPTTASSVYTAPFTVSTATTVKAIAKDANNTLSPIVTASYTFVIPPPVISANPAAGNYPTYPISVALTATSPKPPVTMYYTTNGTTPTTSSMIYTNPIVLGTGGTAATLKVIGKDAINQISPVFTQSYTFLPIPDIWVYFKKPTTWSSSVKIHYWNVLPTGSLPSTTWPGVAMTQDCGDWYKFKFSGITSVNIIFTDGAGHQTTDLNRTVTGWYDNAWSNTAPASTSTPTLSVAPAGPLTSATAIAVTATATGCFGPSTIYYTTNGTTPTTASPSVQNTLSLNIAQTTTLKLFAQSAQGVATPVATHVYTISACTAPNITATPAAPYASPTAYTVVLNSTACGGVPSTIYYTTNGTTPTTASPSGVGSVTINVPQSMMIRAKALNSQGVWSALKIFQYSVATPCTPSVTFTPASPYASTAPFSVTLTTPACGTAASTIYYTTNGTSPTTLSPSAVGSVTIPISAATTTVKAFAKNSQGFISASQTHTYTIGATCPVPTITATPAAGTYTSTVTAVIKASACNTPSTIYYTLNGTTPTTASASVVGTLTQTFTSTKTVKCFAVNSQGLASTVKTYTYVINTPCTAPVVTVTPAGPYTGTSAVSVSISATSCGATASTIYYTTNGTTPTTASTSAVGTTTLNISQTTTLKVFAVNNQGTSAAIQTHQYTIAPPACVAPVVTVTPSGPMTSSSPIAVSISATACNGAASTIYYTTNGNTPSTASTSATGTVSLNITQTTTLQVYAVNSQGQASAIQSHVYTITQAGFTVYFKKPSTYTAAKIYYWNVVPTGAMPTVTWPGVNMTAGTCDWYSFTFNNTNSTSIIFTDGAGHQTADLTRNTTGWYYNGAWHATNPEPNGCNPPVTYTMDGTLDASATQVAGNSTVSLYGHYNGTKLYIATQSASTQVKDVFMFVSTAPGAMAAAPWAKAGQVAGNNIYLANESSNNYSGWTGANANATKASGAWLEGTIDIASQYGTPTQVYVAVGNYGTADAGVLSGQAPVAVTANGNIEATEFYVFNLGTTAALNSKATDDDTALAILSAEKMTTLEEPQLFQNRPNPVQDLTEIPFYLPTASTVRLVLYDMLGNEVLLLKNDTNTDAGMNLVQISTLGLARGMYVYVLQVGDTKLYKKMMVN